jgi:transposase
MKKNNTQNPRGRAKIPQPITIGIDLGDRASRYCLLAGETMQEGSVPTTKKAMLARFGALPRCRIALEVGAHSRWVYRLLRELGHEVYVANARQVKLITQSTRKDDRLDAQTLARLARVDPQLLRPIRHRSDEAQLDLVAIRARAALVEARTALINAVRGLAKSFGERLPDVDAEQMGMERAAALPEVLRERLRPLLEQVESLTAQIRKSDLQIEQIGRSRYPEIELLQQVHGVGTWIALSFVLTLEDRTRFQKSRDVGCYVGLRPKRSESGQRRPELSISKEGDVYLRKLLVQGAHGILRQRAPDTDLKRWGRKLAGRGGKNAKKRAVVAVARKLAVLLHRLWVSGEVYEPLRHPAAPARRGRARAAA